VNIRHILLWFSAGLVAAYLIPFLLAVFIHTEACERWVGLNTISYHANQERNYNEKNGGIFLECSGRWGYQIGYYENSYKRDTFYGVVTYQPWHLFGIRFGGMAGMGTGYREKNEQPRGGLSPLIAGLVSVEGKHAGANVIVGTSVVGLQLKVKF